ncbi:DUF3299 domain-containing protein [Pseudomonas sp. CAU 1711]|uniref:DUF3299 domain-containing protein n=1 Tax=Pseudomonas sp. CAU 1711 TaxID=3140356 RepID=UPI0032604ED9
MSRLFALTLLFCCALACAEPAELDWPELMPAEDRAALEAMSEISHEGLEAAGDFAAGLRQAEGLPEVMYSKKTVARLDGQSVRLGGYPVPLESDAEGRSTLLFLVPYPGACIHVPPPPPNQIVLVRYPEGIALEDIYTPLWVDGTLRVEAVDNDLAEASYALDAASVRPVDEDDL